MSFIGARVYSTTAQSVPNGVGYKVTFENERFDSDNIHSTTTNTTRLTCQTAGKYLITAVVSWNYSNLVGKRQAGIWYNDSAYITMQSGPPANAAFEQSLTTIWDMAVGDYVELYLYQNSGQTVGIDYSQSWKATPELSMALLDSASASGYNDIEDMDDFTGAPTPAQAGRPVIVNEAGDGFEIAGSGDAVVVYGLDIDKDM